MLKSENGIVGFFDIMGYQNIIDNNDIGIVVKIISDTFDALPDACREDIRQRCNIEPLSTFANFITDKIKYLLISDSIIISLSLNNSDDEEFAVDRKILHWIYFFVFTSLLLRKAFDAGLPLRGAIDNGPYFIQEYKFAGKPIIEAYRLSARLQFSGCVLTNNAMNDIEELRKTGDTALCSLFDFSIFSYLAPLSDKNEKLYFLDWLVGKPRVTDIRQYIVNSFHAHNKDVPRKVFPLIDNTEMIIRYIGSRRQSRGVT